MRVGSSSVADVTILKSTARSDSAGWRRRGALLVVLAVLAGCASARARPPSILLVVLDTTRVDAVSAYGAGTHVFTPTTDRLAAGGLRFARAYAQAPWTLPSHASLFTGLTPSQHGVNWRSTWAADDLVTLAEALRDADYETVGISENPWISAALNMAQGFDRFVVTTGFTLTHDGPEPSPAAAETVRAVGEWLGARRADRPFFLFVNLLDAHLPYLVRSETPFLPAGVTPERARAVPQNPSEYLCQPRARTLDVAILHGLYLGGVRAADAKLGAVLELLRSAGLDRDVITMVTADHGEHFGEHQMVGHQFSVREALLHVPLIVHGLRDVAPAVIDAPVALVDVMPTLLQLSGARVPDGLAGRPLPLAAGAAVTRDQEARVILAEHDDSADQHTAPEPELARLIRQSNQEARRNCPRDAPVFGEMRAVLRYPLKLLWYARYPPELYDLSADPWEAHNLAAAKPSLVASLTADMEHQVRRRPVTNTQAPGGPPGTLPPDVEARLRALGYLKDARPGVASPNEPDAVPAR
jgi:arylsulfatase A-like enzyme